MLLRRVLPCVLAAAAAGLFVGCGGGGGGSSATEAAPGSGTSAPVTAPPATGTTPPVSGSVQPAPAAPSESAMPAWRQGLAVGEWREIANTALSRAPMAVSTFPSLGATGPQSKVIAWTGFSADTRDSSLYSAANGGHGDYAGNEVNRIRLSDAAPAWTEPRAATAPAQVVANNSHYADGRPTSRHTYYGSVFNEVRGRAMVFGGARWGDGFMAPTVDGFDVVANDWDAARTFANAPTEFANTHGGAVADQKSTGDVYAFANWAVMRWTSASNTWTRLAANTTVYGQAAAAALDTRRNRVLIVGGNNNDHGVFDLGTGAVQAVTLGGSEAAATSGDGNGLAYDPQLDAFLLRKPGAGAVLYRIDAGTFAVERFAVTGGAAIPASTNGVWTRLLYLPQLKGVVYAPDYGSNLWFMRTN